MSRLNESQHGHRILPAKAILSSNKEQIKELLLNISKIHNVTIEDASLALQNVLRNMANF